MHQQQMMIPIFGYLAPIWTTGLSYWFPTLAWTSLTIVGLWGVNYWLGDLHLCLFASFFLSLSLSQKKIHKWTNKQRKFQSPELNSDQLNQPLEQGPGVGIQELSEDIFYTGSSFEVFEVKCGKPLLPCSTLLMGWDLQLESTLPIVAIPRTFPQIHPLSVTGSLGEHFLNSKGLDVSLHFLKTTM